MNCKLDHDLIQSLLEGTLNTVEKIVVEEHLKECESCRREYREMKLLFIELDELQFDYIDVPNEVATIQNKVIESYVGSSDSQSFGIKELAEIHRNIFENTSLFLEFMPGVKPGAAYIEKGIKKAPSMIYKAIGGAFTGGRKLLLMRARA